jgi:hypothetical protein
MADHDQKQMNNVPAIVEDDGIDIYEGELDSGSLIKGRGQLKFYHPDQWTLGKGKEEVPPGTELIPVKILRVSQQWVNEQRRPITRILAAGEKFPDVDALNEAAPPETWRAAFGQMKGPYENAYIVYFMTLKTREVFTYVANTSGGMMAVRELRESASMARRMDGPAAVPVVLPSHTFMQTKHGGRQRPDFKIDRYVEIGGPAAPRQLTSNASAVA